MTDQITPRPDLSVVVPYVNRWSDVSGCLEALRQQSGVRLEVIVAHRLGSKAQAQLRRDFPEVKAIEAPSGTTIPALRALAFDAASADSVAVIEDHVIVPGEWAIRLLEIRNSGAKVAAGAVENAATETWVDWAAFLCEYSHLLPPIEAGSVEGVTGNNTIYSRETLVRHRAVTHAGLWENHLHDAIKAEGEDLICDPTIVVGHKMHYSVWDYLSQRYLYSRSYAGARFAEAGMPKRLIGGFASVALPPLLLYRILSRCLSKDISKWLVVRSIPLLTVFVGGWAAGEAVGAWFGPGDALSKVK